MPCWGLKSEFIITIGTLQELQLWSSKQEISSVWIQNSNDIFAYLLLFPCLGACARVSKGKTYAGGPQGRSTTCQISYRTKLLLKRPQSWKETRPVGTRMQGPPGLKVKCHMPDLLSIKAFLYILIWPQSWKEMHINDYHVAMHIVACTCKILYLNVAMKWLERILFTAFRFEFKLFRLTFSFVYFWIALLNDV